jgi:signal transduction histidine kinase
MFSSLRSRLWLSYALVLFAGLFLTACLLILYLLRSPVVYRQVESRLTAVQAVILADNPDLGGLPPDERQSTLMAYDRLFGVRVLVYDAGWKLLNDSRAGIEPVLRIPARFPRLLPRLGLRDERGAFWLYDNQSLPDGTNLLLAVQRPQIPLAQILRGEVFLPFTIAGMIALGLSLFAALGLARWIGSPLQKLVEASHQMPDRGAETTNVRPSGPREVQELTQAFNAMTARVQASQKSQREFVANVSHELKTPLTSIQGFAQALQDGTAEAPEARQQAAGIIYDEAGRMHRMVLDLLDLARLDAGTLELQRVPVDVPALLRSVADKFVPQARAAGISIRVKAPVLPAITGDGDRLAQVFTNLVDNALKFTSSGGSVTLRAAPADSGLLTEVEDSGAGIPPEALARIFDRFYQVDPSRSGGEKHGAGLGLAIVKEIVTAHGGKISVRSTPGKGSTFTVFLPTTMPDATTVLAKKGKPSGR